MSFHVIWLLVRCALYIVGYPLCLPKLWVWRQNTPVGSEPPELGMKRHKGWPAAGASGFSHQGLPGKITWNHIVRNWPGDALTPVWSYGEVLALAGSHLRRVTQDPLGSWLGIMVLSLRLLDSSRAWALMTGKTVLATRLLFKRDKFEFNT
jgi:hypothetical protein